MKALIPIAFVAGSIGLACVGETKLAGYALYFAFMLGAIALIK